jgi:hypothetical protein
VPEPFCSIAIAHPTPYFTQLFAALQFSKLRTIPATDREDLPLFWIWLLSIAIT